MCAGVTAHGAMLRADLAPASESGSLRVANRARRVRMQDHRQRGHKIYSPHAPEVECIGKGNSE